MCVFVCFQGSSTQEMWFTECWQQHNTSLHLWQTLTPASPETQLSSILTMVRDRRTGLCVCVHVCVYVWERQRVSYLTEICSGKICWNRNIQYISVRPSHLQMLTPIKNTVPWLAINQMCHVFQMLLFTEAEIVLLVENIRIKYIPH